MNYREGVFKTLASDHSGMLSRISDKKMLDLLHGIIGLSTEVGELLDQIKKHVFYGKALDERNLLEELGDVRYYMEVIMASLGITMEEVEITNHAKLEKRYKGKEFSS